MTLVEVVVAFLLLGIGIAAITTAGSAALRMSRDARSTASHTLIAAAIADSLATIDHPTGDSLRTGTSTAAWSVTRLDNGLADIHLRLDRRTYRVLGGPALPAIP